jgi:hypothetical protein
MSGNRIYRGPMDRQPRTVSDKTVAAALLPGTFVTEGATLAQATAPGPMVRLLANRDFYSAGQLDAVDPLLLAYASGETGVAYVIEPGQEYQAAMAAATYTFGQELTVAAAGRLAAAAQGNIVVAFCKQAGEAAAGALRDVEIANFYAKP